MASNKLQLELLWWVATFLIALLFCVPILLKISSFSYLPILIVFIVLAVTFTRYIFFLKHTFLAHRQILKVALFIITIPVIFLLIEQVNGFISYVDTGEIMEEMKFLQFDAIKRLRKYIITVTMFFGVSAVISTIAFGFRMIQSVWLLRNRGRV